MGWLNEFDWCLLCLLIMKLAVLWTVAACVAAIDLSCEEYCSLSSGSQTVKHQPGCDCMYVDTDLEDSGIYYEPAYVPLPTFIYNHPFYIINPILQIRGKNSTNVPPQTINIHHMHSKHVSDPTGFNAKIEIDIDNTQTHKRKEKDIQADHQRSNNPPYLDIRFKAEDSERAASINTFTAEDLRRTEHSFSECTELYAFLNYRKNNNTIHLDSVEPGQLHKYDHLSNGDLMKAIDNRCLQISNILEKSLNEIKANRPTKTNISVMNSIISQNDEINESLRNTGILNTQNDTDIIAEKNIQEPANVTESNKTVKQDYGDKDYTDVNFTESEPANESRKHSTIPSQLATTVDASTSGEGIATLTDSDSQRDAQEVITVDPESSSPSLSVLSTEIDPTFKSIYFENEYPLATESPITDSFNDVELSTPPYTNNKDQDILQNKVSVSETESGLRDRYKEEDIPLAKVITHEFNNNTVQSYINGTEDISNDDFKNSDSDDSRRIMVEAESNVPNRRKIPFETDIHGNLIFLVKQHQIPARFIQQPNGTIHVGIDAITICDQFKKDGEFVSKLFSILCKCYESDNCTSILD